MNDPETQLPLRGEPLAQSIETLNVTSVSGKYYNSTLNYSGEWYNFTMDFSAYQNTVYWLGYYSDNYTRYFFDYNDGFLSVTSQPKDELTSLLPDTWAYEGKSIMSICALYTFAEPQPTPTLPPDSSDIQSSSGELASGGSFGYTIIVLAIIGGESTVALAYQIHKKKKNTRHQELGAMSTR